METTEPHREPEPRLLAEQTRQLYRSLPAVLITAALAAALLVTTHWSLRPRELLVGWSLAFIAVVAARIATLIGYRRADPGAPAGRWYARFQAVTLASALTWGSAAWVFFAAGAHDHQALLAFVAAGLGAGGAVHFGVRWQCAWTFLIPALVPFVLRFRTLESPTADVTAALIGLYIAALMWMSVQRSRQAREAIRARTATAERFAVADRDRRLYRSLVESTTAIIWEGDPETFEFSYVSPEAEQLLGYAPERWTGEPAFWRNHIHPDDRERAIDYCVRATREKRRHTFDYRMTAADGRTVWLRDVVNVVLSDGEPTRLVGVMIDITELKETERDLGYVSGLQRLLVDASREVFGAGRDEIDAVLSRTLERVGRWCGVDRSYLIRFSPDRSRFTNTHEWVADGVNPEIGNLQDVPIDTIPKLFAQLKSRQRVVIPRVDALDRSWSAERELLSAQDIQSLVCLPIFSDAELTGLIGFDSVRRRREWDDEEVALLQVLGDLIGVAGERLGKELQLRASEALRAHAEALAGLGSWEWEVGSDEFQASVEWRKVMGCGSGPLTRDQVIRLTPEAERREVLEALRDTVERGVEYNVEHRVVRPDSGEERWVSVHGELVEGDDGRRTLRGFAQDVTERRKSEEKLFHLAHYDELTSLPNRVLVFDRLQQALRRARRSNAEIAALFIDLDMFKKVNDTLGHDAGDQVLVDAAARLTGLFREQDTVARIGGDEFLVVVDGFGFIGEVTALAARVLEAFREPVVVEGREFVLTASIGIAVAPHDGASAPDLLRNADTAMYHAKETGRDSYQFFTRSMNEAVERQLDVEQALRSAADRDELYLVYQPLIRLPERDVVGAEALLRWRHPELGDVSPEEFIPIAEQSGQIVALGHFVVRTVVEQVARWRRDTAPDFTVSINVSPRQFRNGDIVETIARALDRNGIAGAALDVEVTEGLLLPGRRDVRHGMDALRARGVGLVMDDFGTGYASLRYLRDHPFTSLKIDRGFIRGLDSDDRHRKLVVSALRLGRALDMKVVAEGVETESELAVLENEGCDRVQGFLFSQPLSAAELGGLLDRAGSSQKRDTGS